MDLGFTPDGRVLQIEAAEEATRRGAPIVGMVFRGGVVLGAKYVDFGDAPRTSLGGNGSELRGGKILRLGPRLALAGVGLSGDLAAVGRHMRSHPGRTTLAAVDRLGEFFWQHSIRHDVRRLATMVLLASTMDAQPRLFQFSPSGSIHECQADAWGAGMDRAQRELRGALPPGSEKEARATTLRLLGDPPVYELLILRAREGDQPPQRT